MSENSGTSWRELEGFQELPSREEWFTPRHRNKAHVRSLDTHPDTPDRVIAGVKIGGVHPSDDHGETGMSVGTASMTMCMTYSFETRRSTSSPAVMVCIELGTVADTGRE